ncbi:MAG: isopenicillin N synthase family oxygenase, partial [Microcoleus sp. SIO2G3]|nr:isopenicillin N synthase family oxygenase [Microcoleus sp. SIO2G3]
SNELPNRWPDQPPQFRSIALEFFAACAQTADAVLTAMAIALQLPPNFFTVRHCDRAHTLRLLHYPPHSDTGAAAHTDYGSITLLFQDDMAGLEVQTVAGEWLAVPPVSNSVLVNLGDLIQRWTNDEYRSTLHRVRLVAGADRYSIAYFCNPNSEVEIACLPLSDPKGLPKRTRPARYAPISASAYLLSRLQETYSN